MEAKDLRIGNNVFDKDGKIITINSISIFGINLRVVDLPNQYLKEDGFDEIQPIPLIEEILLKCPIMSKEENRIFLANLGKDKDGYFIWISGFKKYFKYLHEYQNLYFVLTNEELEINL